MRVLLQLSALLTVFCVSSIGAQEPEPSKPELIQANDAVGPTRVVGSWLATVEVDGQEIQVFEMPGNPYNVVYTAPYRFQLDSNNKVLVEKQELTYSAVGYEDKVRAVITLVKNPQGTRSKIAEALRNNGIKPDITEANVNPADVTSLKIKDITDGIDKLHMFTDFDETYPSGQMIQLGAFIPKTQFDGFSAWVQTGAVRFKVTQQVVGERVDWEQTLDLNSLSYQAINLEISAEGPVVPGDILKSVPPFVTRKQRDSIMSRVKERVRVDMRTMGKAPSESEIASFLPGILDRAFVFELIKFDDQELWNRLDQQSLLKNGIDPTRIESFRHEFTEKTDEQKASAMKASLDTAANADVLGLVEIGGSAKAAYESSQSEHKVHEKGLVYDIKGDLQIPVGFLLFRASDDFVSRIKEISFRNARTTQTLIESRSVISTAAPRCWVVKEVQVDQYAVADLVKVNKYAQGLVSLSSADSTTAAEYVPPARKEVLGAIQFPVNQNQLLRGMRLKLTDITAGTGPMAPGDTVYLITVTLNNEAGDNVVHQLLFIGQIAGVVEPIGVDYSPVSYIVTGNTLYAFLRGPLPFQKKDESKP